MREVQDRFDSRRLADRLEKITLHGVLSEADRAFVDSATMFFLATADADANPDCSYKGGRPGFIRAIDDATVAFAVYDGNGQFRSLGNITANPSVGLLFIDFDLPSRLRINGSATVTYRSDDPDLVGSFPGADAVVVVAARQIFPNCPRYVHRSSTELCEYAPAEDHVPPVPEWKTREIFQPYLPRIDTTT